MSKCFFYFFNSKINVQIDITELDQVFCEDNPLWTEKSNESYDTWISNITSAVANCFNNFYSKSLIPLFNLNVQFCELTLPRLISLIIHFNLNLMEKVCQCINRFFNFYFDKDGENNKILCSSSQVTKNLYTYIVNLFFIYLKCKVQILCKYILFAKK
jgi:hypothetical protein